MTEIQKKGQTNADTQPKAVNTASTGARKPFQKFDRNGKKPFKKFDRKKGGRRNNRRDEKPEFLNEILSVRRVTRVVKGGKRMRFSCLIVLGDKKGKVGYGLKKGTDFQSAIQKATNQAKKNMITIKINEAKTIEFPIKTKFKAAEVFLKPADVGTGLIAGSFVRTVLQLAGIENVYSKVLGTNNKITGVQAIFKALEQFKK